MSHNKEVVPVQRPNALEKKRKKKVFYTIYTFYYLQKRSEKSRQMVRRWAIAGLVSPKCNVSQQRNDNGKGKKKEFVNQERVIKTGSLT